MLPAEIRYKEIKRVALNMLGNTEQNEYNLEHLRKEPFPTWRSMIALQMSREGYSLSSIGRCMGRDHSTMSYHINSMWNIINSRLSCHRDTIELYSTFKKNVEKMDKDHDGWLVIARLGDIKTILNNCGIEKSEINFILENIKKL